VSFIRVVSTLFLTCGVNGVVGYYDAFPSKSMNVAVKIVDVVEADGETKKRKVLVATKDFEAGEVIYKVKFSSDIICSSC
jgi:hypothetical protein